MAVKTTPATAPKQTTSNGIPKPTDPRAELFFLLGAIKGQGVESADRITSLVIDLTASTPATSEAE